MALESGIGGSETSKINLDVRTPKESLERILIWLQEVHGASASGCVEPSLRYDDLAIRTLHATLPSLCAVIFGSTTSIGWLHRSLLLEEERLLMKLLAPDGYLITWLISMVHDRAWVYVMRDDKLPEPTAAALLAGDHAALPEMYLGRVVTQGSTAGPVPMVNSFNTPSRQNSFTDLTSSTPNLQFNESFHGLGARSDANPTVMFSMFEFYFYYFAWSLVGSRAAASGLSFNNSSSSGAAGAGTPGYDILGRIRRVADSGFPSTEQNRVRNANRWYIRLLRCYLSFFVPTTGGSSKVRTDPADPGVGGSHESLFGLSASSPRKIFNDMTKAFWGPSGSKPDSYMEEGAKSRRYGFFGRNVFSTGTDQRRNQNRTFEKSFSFMETENSELGSRRLNCSQFFVGCLVECWLNQNSYETDFVATANGFTINQSKRLSALVSTYSY
jgi:hypothetical protein